MNENANPVVTDLLQRLDDTASALEASETNEWAAATALLSDMPSLLRQARAELGRLREVRESARELARVLERERHRLQVIMENTHVQLAYLDPEFNLVMVNSAYVQGSGYGEAELIGRNHFELFPHTENQAIFERVRDTGEPVEFHAKSFEYPERPELGITYWDWTLTPVEDGNGEVEGLVLSLFDVTEQVRAQAEIESLCRFPSENPNPVLRAGADGSILYANEGSRPLLAEWDAQVGEKLPDAWQRLVAGAVNTGVGQVSEAPCDGRTFLLAIAPVTQEGYANLYGLDVTEQKRAQQALWESEERFRDLYENAPNAYIGVGVDGRIRRCNRQAGELLGYAVEELVGRPVLDLYADTSHGKEKAAKVLQRFRAGETVRDEELQMQKVDGIPVWISLTVNAVRDVQGRIIESRSMVVDITERKRAEEALQQYAERLQGLHEVDQAILAARSVEEIAGAALQRTPQLLDCLRACITLVDLEAREMSLLAAYSGDEIVLDRDWRAAIDDEWARALETLAQGVAYFVEDVRHAPPTSEWWRTLQTEGVHALVALPLIIEGELIGSLNLGMRRPGPLTTDQMEIARELAIQAAIGIRQARLHEHVQRHADELEKEVQRRTRALRASEARFRAIFEGAGIGIALVDGKGRIEESNPALQELLGYSAEELRGKPLTDFSHPDDVTADTASYVEMMAHEGSGGRYRLEGRYIRRDGRLCWANVTVSLVQERGRKHRFAVIMMEDVTERKRAQEALIQSEKLAVTGRLAASLAHEINNPLQSVIGCLELVEDSLAQGKDVGQFLQLATSELERTANIVGQLRDLNRPKSEERKPTDVAALVDHMLVLTRSKCQKQRVEVELKAAGDLPPLVLVPDRIQQVFLNLVLNAVEAMPEGGRLEVRASPTGEPAGVRISFADSGEGVPASTASHLFEPFYTTKPDGLGMGLYITHNIVEEHGGHIEVESREGEGAMFTVWLPA